MFLAKNGKHRKFSGMNANVLEIKQRVHQSMTIRILTFICIMPFNSLAFYAKILFLEKEKALNHLRKLLKMRNKKFLNFGYFSLIILNFSELFFLFYNYYCCVRVKWWQRGVFSIVLLWLPIAFCGPHIKRNWALNRG